MTNRYWGFFFGAEGGTQKSSESGLRWQLHSSVNSPGTRNSKRANFGIGELYLRRAVFQVCSKNLWFSEYR